MSVNVGTLEGLLQWKADDTALQKSLDSVAQKANVHRKDLDKYNREIDRITSSYNKVAASLDPTIAATQRYERAQKTLDNALKHGLIAQEQHTRQLGLARDKYITNSSSTLTWRQEIVRLTDHVGILNGTLGSHLALVRSVGASLSVMLPVLAALAIAFGSVYVAVKTVNVVFDALSNAIESGLKTQQLVERLNNTLRITGSYADLSSASLIILAERYELLTARSKEEILAAETILARFQSLNRDAYPKALDLTLAYAKAMGITADQAANKLGPAFEGSTRSLNSFREAGIVLTASQRKFLLSLIEQGDKAQYVSTVIELLRAKVGEVSQEYDNNLTRQVGRAHIVLEDFGEAIASEVIPALEDLVSGLVEQLGGWENIKRVISEAGSVIGNVIRKMVYGAIITYHEWGMAQNRLEISLADSLARILKNFSDAAQNYADLVKRFTSVQIGNTKFEIGVPGPEADQFEEIAKKSAILSDRLSKTSGRAREDLKKHGAALQENLKKILEHRKALEGDEKVYKSTRDALSSLGKARDEDATKLKQLNSLLAEQTEKIRYLNELRSLAARGPLSTSERIREEARINEEHEHRVRLLQLQEQFGKQIGKQLADQERLVKKLEREVKIELIASLRLQPIEIDLGFGKDLSAKSQVQRYFQNAEAAMTKSVQILADYEEDYARFNQAQNDWLQGYAEDWRQSFKTFDQIARDNIAAIRAAVEEGYLTVVEGERAIAQVRADQLSQHVGQWQTFFSYLGNALGGVFQQISQLISQVQAGIQAGQQLGSQMSGIGAAAGGIAGGIVAVWLAAYDYMQGQLAKRKAESYNVGIALGGRNEFGDFTSPLQGEARRATLQVQRTIEAFAESLGGVVETFASLEVKIRRDGKYFRAFVEGVFIGSFQDMQSAVEAAILAGLRSPETMFSGVSELIRQGLEYALSDGVVKVGSLEELEDFLGKLKEISDLDLGSSAIVETLDSIRHFDRLGDALRELSGTTEEVIRGWGNLGVSEARTWQALFDSITGRQPSEAEIRAQKENELRIARAELDIRKASIAQRILMARAEIAAYQAGNRLIGGGPGGSGGGGNAAPTGGSGGGILGMARAFSVAGQTLAATTHLVAATVGTATEAMISALNAEIAGLEALMEALNNLQIPDIGPIGGRGGGTSDRDSVRDFIRDRSFELSLRGLTEYQRSLAEINRQYDEQLRQAGRDIALRNQLIALREREIELLEQETRQRLTQSFREFIGTDNQFDRVRQTARDLIREIENSPFGSPRKARMIERILDSVNRQIERMAQESAVSLFGEMLSDLEKFGASEAQMSEIRNQMAIIEHTLKLNHYRTEIEILRAQGVLTAQVLGMLDNALRFLEGVDPVSFAVADVHVPVSNFSESVDKTTDDLERLRESFKDAKESISETLRRFDRGEMGFVTPEDALAASRKQFEDLFSRASRGEVEAMRDVSPAFENLLDSLKSFSPDLFNLEAPRLRQRLESLLNVSTIREGNLTATEFGQQEQTRVINTGLAHMHYQQSQTNTHLADMRVSSINAIVTQRETRDEIRLLVEEQRTINAKLSRLESGDKGLKRNVN